MSTKKCQKQQLKRFGEVNAPYVRTLKCTSKQQAAIWLELPTRQCESRTVSSKTSQRCISTNLQQIASVMLHKIFQNVYKYLPKITLKEPRTFLAHNRLMNPLLITFSKVTNLSQIIKQSKSIVFNQKQINLPDA